MSVNSGSGITAGTHIWVVIKDIDNKNIAYIYMAVTQSYQIQSTFVRKGMKVQVTSVTATNNYSITYTPLIS